MFSFDRTRCQIIGMIHVGALPGTPRAEASVTALSRQAVQEAHLYQAAGVDAIMLENMHDVPYLRQQVGPEIVAAMTRIAVDVRQTVDLPCGVQILAGANEAAMAVALAAELDFVRVEGFVFAHVADEGWLDACAGPLLRYRRQIAASHIQVWADIKKKHSAHSVTADVDLTETAQAAAFFGCDAVIVSGTATGAATNPDDLAQVCESVSIPVLVGSGVTQANLTTYLPHAAGLIVGSHFKQGGHWAAPLDEARLNAFMTAVRQNT